MPTNAKESRKKGLQTAFGIFGILFDAEKQNVHIIIFFIILERHSCIFTNVT
jgi:hypothetical protein